MSTLMLTVNGQRHTVDVDPLTPAVAEIAWRDPQQRIETIVVDFKFQFLIETIQHFRLDAVAGRHGAIWGPFCHSGLQLQKCWVRVVCVDVLPYHQSGH